MTETLTIRRPDDWHLHLRDGAMLRAVAPETARHFARAIIMPNLVPPVVTGADAAAYRERILSALPEGSSFTPLMTLYLTPVLYDLMARHTRPRGAIEKALEQELQAPKVTPETSAGD